MPYFRVFRTTTEEQIVDCKDEIEAIRQCRQGDDWVEIDQDHFAEPLSDKEVEELED